MHYFSSILHEIRTWIFVTVAAVLVLPTRGAAADDLLGLYVGGAIGQSHIKASGRRIYAGGDYFDTGSFNEKHSAFKVTIGIHPISWLGAELSYMDLGHPSGTFHAYPTDVNMKGGSAFGVLYLPVRMIDFFVKAGIARIQSEVNGTGFFAPNCSMIGPCSQLAFLAPFQLDRTNTSGAAGAAAQYRFGSLAVRAEYERFNAAGEHPTLLSLGLTWSF
jgi:hypothetical protein